MANTPAGSLEQFRVKHGQLAYNTLMKSVENSRKQPKPTNNSLSQFATKLMQQPSNNVTSAQRVPRIRGTSDLPLNAEGLQQADDRARQIATKGGMDVLVTSPLQRAKNTAAAISKASGGTPIHEDERAMPWHLGMFEGEPVDKVKNFISKFANDHPDSPIPGRGPISVRDGESFNSFKQRWIGGMLKPLMEAHAQDPSSKVGIVTHLRDILAAKSWVENGARKDLQFDHHDINYEAVSNKEEMPSTMFSVKPDGQKWKFAEEDTEDPKPFDPGIYFIRHGETDWNSTGGRGAS